MRLEAAPVARFLILAWFIPAALSYIAYFGFSGLYAGEFSEAGFAATYDHGIFKYRVLGTTLLRLMHDVVNVYGLPTYAPEVLVRAYPSVSPAFYSAFFYLNTLVLCLTASVLFVVVSRFGSAAIPEVSDLVLIASVGLIAFSQFAVAPYDMLAYLFLVLAIYLIDAGRTDPRRFGALCLVMVLAALTRETAAIILSFYFAVHFGSLARPSRIASGALSHRVVLGILVACFLAVYVSLRLWLGPGDAVYHRIRLSQNFTDNFSLVGALFFAASVALALLHERGRRTSMLFVMASAPYWIAMFVISNPREIRIWVPILVPLLLIQLRGDTRR